VCPRKGIGEGIAAPFRYSRLIFTLVLLSGLVCFNTKFGVPFKRSDSACPNLSRWGKDCR
jgi:hypothetical protein